MSQIHSHLEYLPQEKVLPGKVPPELFHKPPPTILLSLPNQLLLLIGDHLDSKDLYSLSHTHRRLLLLFTPVGDEGLKGCQIQSGVPFQKIPKVRYYPELPFEKLPRLHSAALKGQHQVVQDLLGDPRWPDANERASDFQGKTPLYFAVVGGHESIVRLLLDRGAAVNTPAEVSNGKSALHMAVSGCHEGVVRLLLKRGAAVSYEDYKGRTPIVWAARSAPPGKELVDVFQLLLESGAGVNNCDLEYCSTVLHWAVLKGRKDTVKLLLDKGACVMAPNLCIKTPISWALENGDEEMIKILHDRIYNRADPTVARPKGWGITGWIKKFRLPLYN